MRDQVILLVAYDTICGRSELISFFIEDMRFLEINWVAKASALISKNKTDRLGKSRRLNLSQKATEVINLLLERLRNPKER
jgi:hypothetical protein